MSKLGNIDSRLKCLVMDGGFFQENAKKQLDELKEEFNNEICSKFERSNLKDCFDNAVWIVFPELTERQSILMEGFGLGEEAVFGQSTDDVWKMVTNQIGAIETLCEDKLKQREAIDFGGYLGGRLLAFLLATDLWRLELNLLDERRPLYDLNHHKAELEKINKWADEKIQSIDFLRTFKFSIQKHVLLLKDVKLKLIRAKSIVEIESIFDLISTREETKHGYNSYAGLLVRLCDIIDDVYEGDASSGKFARDRNVIQPAKNLAKKILGKLNLKAPKQAQDAYVKFADDLKDGASSISTWTASEAIVYFKLKKEIWGRADCSSSYTDLKAAYEKIRSTLVSTSKEFPNLTERANRVNQIFLLNNIISLYAKSLYEDVKKISASDGSGANRKIESEIEYLIELTKEVEESSLSDMGESDLLRFTHFKMARLHLDYANFHLCVLKESQLDGKNLEERLTSIEEGLNKAGEYLKKSTREYNAPGGGHHPFHGYISTMKDSGIFCLSGFSIPIRSNFFQDVSKIEILIGKAHGLVQLERTHERIRSGVKSIEAARKTAEAQSMKTVELLSVFAAIVLFVSSNVQIYQYIGGIVSAVIFMVGMAISLVLFAFVVVSLVRGWIVSLLIVLLASMSLLAYLVTSKGDNLYGFDKTADIELFNKSMVDGVKDSLLKDFQINASIVNKGLTLTSTGSSQTSSGAK